MRKCAARGITTVVEGSILDAPDERLVDLYIAAREQRGKHGKNGMQRMIAAELVRRGALHGCGCEGCSAMRTDALAWEAHCKEAGVDPRSCEPV